jgi:hypothetical protein
VQKRKTKKNAITPESKCDSQLASSFAQPSPFSNILFMAFHVEFCKPAIQILECEKDVEITCRLAYCDGVEGTRDGV